MPKIGIRADGNESIGTGHIMRCLAIAEQLKELGNDVLFIVSDSKVTELISSKGFDSLILHSEWNNLDVETSALNEAITENKIALLLIDTYFVTSEYLSKVRNVVKTAYIDDIFAFDYPVDILINYSAYADKNRYVDHKDTCYYLGTSYAPLRSQFQNLCINEAKNKTILVLSGGTDPYHLTTRLPEALLKSDKLSDYSFFVVQGVFADESKLVKSDRVTYFKNVTDMVGLMQQSMLAISAGGITLYELCNCQVPTVTYSFVDNQVDNVKAFSRLNVMPYAGDLRNGEEETIESIVKNLEQLASESLSDKKALMGHLVDGNGAFRIAKVLTESV